MVEANEEIKAWGQPQDNPTPDADDAVSGMIAALEKNYNEEMITERLEALRKFKEEVSVFSLRYAKFESEQQPKLKGLPVFEKGLKFYNEQNLRIIQELDNEIKRSEKEKAGVKAFREIQLKKIMMVFHSTPQTINALKTNENKKLEAAIDTMRDLPVFGMSNFKVNYRWPRERDLL